MSESTTESTTTSPLEMSESNNYKNKDMDMKDHEILAIKMGDRSIRNTFISAVIVMFICGSSNDYFGKLAYQTLHESGLVGVEIDYWALWMLTTGSFFICSFAVFTKSARKSYKILTKISFLKICVPAFLDLPVTGGRYLALLFLPAEVISILKNGFQLFFLALFRRFWRKKFMTKLQWIGCMIVLIGLIIISVEDILSALNEHFNKATILHIVGVLILILVGFLGAIRNTIEEILLQNEDKSKAFEADFMVGMEAIISLTFMIIIGIVLLFAHPFKKHETTQDLLTALQYIFTFIVFDILFVLFVISIYGKDTMQMRVAKYSSALTRKLLQQLYPIGTWILVLITHEINPLYGEAFCKIWCWIELFGFGVVLFGTYLYVKPPKLTDEQKAEIEHKKMANTENKEDVAFIKSDYDLNVEGNHCLTQV